MSEITKDALQYLWDKGKSARDTVTVGDNTFAPQDAKLIQLHPDPLEPALPLIPLFTVHTLSGLVSVIKEQIDNLADTEYLVHIFDETTVQLTVKTADKHGRRQILAQADAFEYVQFPFAQQITQENFVVWFQSRFVQDDSEGSDYRYVLSIAQNLTAAQVVQSDDNNTRQEVVIRKSVTGKEGVELRPFVTLAPYRTFTEIEQPGSRFLFRTHPTGSPDKPGIPHLSLTEADGGNWKKAAMDSIEAFLKAAQELPVIA